jgi:DNA-binding response OmpR family regulator
MFTNNYRPDILLLEGVTADAELFISAFRRCNPKKHIMWINDGKRAAEYMLSYDTGATAKKPLLVLLDLVMPKLGGFDVLRMVSKSKKSGKFSFIALTDSQNEADRALSYSCGVKSYIRKDIIRGNCSKVIKGKDNGSCLAGILKNGYKDKKI